MDRLAVVPGFCDDRTFHSLREAVTGHVSGERVHIPAHKRGETIAYAAIRRLNPWIAGFYQSTGLATRISEIIGQPVTTTPPHDQSSCSILIYNRRGDRIGWHYDHNFYSGRHFTALLPLVNRGTTEERLSSAQLVVERDGRTIPVPTPANTLVLFEGAVVRHCVTPQGDGELRIVLSMTFCTNPQTTRLKDLQRRFKDVAYIGLRALWT